MPESVPLVIDSGPLIATLFAQDRYHTVAAQGFQQLAEEKRRLILPLPIVFEVYRWLLQHHSSQLAQDMFVVLDKSFEIYGIDSSEIPALREIALRFPNWQGTLGDASVIYIAILMSATVWTLDYRDLGIFDGIEFWNP